MDFYSLAPLYDKWMPDLLGRPIPAEPRATCLDCAMCKKHEPEGPSDYVFNLKTKCCTFIPNLPNYLVGSILLDDDPEFAEARAQFEKAAVQRVVTPLEIAPPWFYWYHYVDKQFGDAESLRCPYYIDRDGGLCGIWKHRNSRCSTWFCKYNRHSIGVGFWKKLDALLTAVEKCLAKWCVSQLDMQLPAEPTDNWRAIWGRWTGKEPEFYKECFRLVSPMTWKEVVECCDAETLSLIPPMLEAFSKLHQQIIPDRLRLGQITREPLPNNMIRVVGYSKYDPLDLDKKLLDVLEYFEGMSWSEAVEWIGKRIGIHISQEMVLNLYEYNILVDAEVTT
jgi:hypothetical protein